MACGRGRYGETKIQLRPSTYDKPHHATTTQVPTTQVPCACNLNYKVDLVGHRLDMQETESNLG